MLRLLDIRQGKFLVSVLLALPHVDCVQEYRLISVIKEIKVLTFTHLRVVPFRKKREMARSAAHTTPLKRGQQGCESAVRRTVRVPRVVKVEPLTLARCTTFGWSETRRLERQLWDSARRDTHTRTRST